MHSLLPFEDRLATSMVDLGCLHSHQFSLQLQPGASLVPSAAHRYPPVEQKWLYDYCLDLEQVGIITPCENIPFDSSVVLV